MITATNTRSTKRNTHNKHKQLTWSDLNQAQTNSHKHCGKSSTANQSEKKEGQTGTKKLCHEML